MSRIIGLAVIGLLLSPLAAAAQAVPPFLSMSVELPTGDRVFPGEAAADPVNTNCLACHSAEMVLTQPPLPRASWRAEVDKMRNLYKAPIDIEDVPAIVDYLTTQSGGK